MALILVAPF